MDDCQDPLHYPPAGTLREFGAAVWVCPSCGKKTRLVQDDPVPSPPPGMWVSRNE